MESSIGIVVGVDLAADYTQISYYVTGMSEPDSMSTIHNEQKYLIPTVLFKWKDKDEWLLGDEAMLRAGRHEGTAVDDILKKVLLDKGDTIEGREYTAKEILDIYFRLLFEQIRRGCNISCIEAIGITIEYPDRVLIDNIYSSVKELGIEEDKIRVVGHSEALLYFITNQKKEIWTNDVALFDFSKDHFIYRKVSRVRGRNPEVLDVSEYDLSDEFSYEDLKNEEGRIKADERLLTIVQNDFKSHIVSAVFLTGMGFYDEDFIKNSLPYLCNKRRVFKGHNLFVKGACYAIMEKLSIINNDCYQFMCTGRTFVTIGINVLHRDKTVMLCLSKAGVNWYEAGAIVKCILDDTKEINVKVINPVNKVERDIKLDLSEFPDRPNKTTKVEITVAYKSEKQLSIIVRDLGFGDFFEASDKILRMNINTEEWI